MTMTTEQFKEQTERLLKETQEMTSDTSQTLDRLEVDLYA